MRPPLFPVVSQDPNLQNGSSGNVSSNSGSMSSSSSSSSRSDQQQPAANISAESTTDSKPPEQPSAPPSPLQQFCIQQNPLLQNWYDAGWVSPWVGGWARPGKEACTLTTTGTQELTTRSQRTGEKKGIQVVNREKWKNVIRQANNQYAKGERCKKHSESEQEGCICSDFSRLCILWDAAFSQNCRVFAGWQCTV